jgi:hypothetical protein
MESKEAMQRKQIEIWEVVMHVLGSMLAPLFGQV